MKLRINLKSGIKSGNAASDKCYYERNEVNLVAWLTHYWYPESNLRDCLSVSGEPEWWRSFPDMTAAKACEITKKNTGSIKLINMMECA